MNVREAAQPPVRAVVDEPGVLCVQETMNGQAWLRGPYVRVQP